MPERKSAAMVAVVCGATRGAGRGAARALGEVGAIVYCTGRSTRDAPSAYQRPETIDETAEMVTAAGGTGIPVRVDHTDEVQVRDLFARVGSEQKRLDVVVDSAAGEDPLYGAWLPLWDADVSQAAKAFTQGLVTRVNTAKYGGTLLRKRKRGLIVEVTGADFPFYGGNLVHDLIMLGHKGLAFRLAEDLRSSKVAAVAITPGFLRSETMLTHFGVTEANWRDGAKKDKYFASSESPMLVGRAIVALARDPDVMRWSGHLTSSWEVAREFGLVDHDGSNPDWERAWRQVMLEQPPMKQGTLRQVQWLERVASRLRSYLTP